MFMRIVTGILIGVVLLGGCATPFVPSDEFAPVTMHTYDFEIFTYQKMTSSTAPVHIYIEGDGRAFDGAGRPTDDPSPHGTFVRNLAMDDSSQNVVYIARPCQFVMSESCRAIDWTSGRFSARVVNAVADVIKNVAGRRPVVLIGYSGGAMLSAIIIQQNPDIDVKKWITIAGVLNHSDWTDYFGDSPLSDSLSVDELPRIPQAHYVASHDTVVPISLTRKWVSDDLIFIVPNSSHSQFKNLKINFK